MMGVFCLPLSRIYTLMICQFSIYSELTLHSNTIDFETVSNDYISISVTTGYTIPNIPQCLTFTSLASVPGNALLSTTLVIDLSCVVTPNVNGPSQSQTTRTTIHTHETRSQPRPLALWLSANHHRSWSGTTSGPTGAARSSMKMTISGSTRGR